MRFPTLAVMLAAIVSLPGATSTVPLGTQNPRSTAAGLDPPRFADPGRRAKLATAFPDIDSTFTEFVRTAHVPGAAWGIVIDGTLAHSGAAGVRDVASQAPVDADTVFRIASMTKSFTAVAILKLRDQGRLSLDDPAERYVPELRGLPYPTSDAPRITIRHLLSHSAGFPEDNPWGDQQLADTDAQLTEMLAERHSLLHGTRNGVRVLELRFCDPRPRRVEGLGHAVHERSCSAISCSRSA